MFFPMQWDETKARDFSQAMPENFMRQSSTNRLTIKKDLNAADQDVDPDIAVELHAAFDQNPPRVTRNYTTGLS